MATTCNSSGTNRLLQRLRDDDQQTLSELFARHRERLRKMVRLRLDRRLRARFSSSAVLADVERDVARRIGEYRADPSLPFFLWLRLLVGERIQQLHRQGLGQVWDAGQELSLYRGALPEIGPENAQKTGRSSFSLEMSGVGRPVGGISDGAHQAAGIR
jgi:hypothetical protein